MEGIFWYSLFLRHVLPAVSAKRTRAKNKKRPATNSFQKGGSTSLCVGARVAGATIIAGAGVAGATSLTGETVAVHIEGSVKGSIPDKGAGAEPKALN